MNDNEKARMHWLDYQLSEHGVQVNTINEVMDLAGRGYSVYIVHEMDGMPEPATAEHMQSNPGDLFISLAPENSPEQHPVIVQTTDMDRHVMYMVPMPVMPSENPENWLKFLVSSAPCLNITAEVCESIQRKMRSSKTEALTDGKGNFYTIAGNALVSCDPLVF